MTQRQLELLRALGYANRRERAKMYWRPLDLGGRDASYHSRVLQQLTRLGFAERAPRLSARAFVYRITARGRKRLAQLRNAQ